jgi:hypothetical protein
LLYIQERNIYGREDCPKERNPKVQEKSCKNVQINLVVSIIFCIFVTEKENNKTTQHYETHF